MAHFLTVPTGSFTAFFIPHTDVSNGDSKENVTIQLNRAQESTASSGDAESKTQNWDINSLSRSLHNLLLVHPTSCSDESCLSPLDNAGKVRVMILYSVMERMLYRTARATIVECTDDIGACLTHAMKIFTAGPGYSTARLNTIGNCIRIMLCLNNPSPQIAARFIEALLVIIDCRTMIVPSDILDYASQAIVRFTTMSKSAIVLSSIENKIDNLLSILENTISSEDRGL